MWNPCKSLWNVSPRPGCVARPHTSFMPRLLCCRPHGFVHKYIFVSKFFIAPWRLKRGFIHKSWTSYFYFIRKRVINSSRCSETIAKNHWPTYLIWWHRGSSSSSASRSVQTPLINLSMIGWKRLSIIEISDYSRLICAIFLCRRHLFLRPASASFYLTYLPCF